MRTPKHKLLAIVVLFIFVACAGTKKTTKENFSSEVKTSANVQKTSSDQEASKTVDISTIKTDSSVIKALQKLEKLTEQYNASVKNYDTSKPVDPVTGKPPLASEMVISNNKTSDLNLTNNVKTNVNKDEKKDISVDYKKLVQQAVDSVMKASSKKHATTEMVKETVSWWWVWLIAGALIMVVIWLIYKYSLLPKLFVGILNLFRVKR